MPPSERRLSQAVTVPLLKVYIDFAMASSTDTERGRRARAGIMLVMAQGDVATSHVLHNIGVKRRKWLMEFLNGTPTP